MSKDLFQDVGDFNRKFGLPAVPTDTKPKLLKGDVVDYRMSFMLEELDEFFQAHLDGDLEKAADALADLAYVVLGTAHLMGIPFDRVWDEVQRANMEKVRSSGADDPRSKRKHQLDVVKPDGWQPPDHRKALGLSS